MSHDGRLLSGAIAFYASLAIAPLGVVALLIASLVMPETAARDELVGQIEAFLGSEMATFLVNAIVTLGEEATSYAAPIFGALFMIYIAALSWLVFAHVPDVWVVFGALVIVFSGLTIWKREQRQ